MVTALIIVLGLLVAFAPFYIRRRYAWTRDDKKLLVLHILAQASPGELFGLEIVKVSDRRVTRGSVYIFLSELEDGGLVTSRPIRTKDDVDMLSRRVYSITPPGLKYLKYMEEGRSSKMAK